MHFISPLLFYPKNKKLYKFRKIHTLKKIKYINKKSNRLRLLREKIILHDIKIILENKYY